MITHDIDETAASRSFGMMTNGPAAQIGEVMNIPFARPRNHPRYGRPRILQPAQSGFGLLVPPICSRGKVSQMSLPEITQQILDAKKAKGITFQDLGNLLSRDPMVAALMFRQASASEDASKLVDALELPKSSCRN